jgi:hypothetical protein
MIKNKTVVLLKVLLCARVLHVEDMVVVEKHITNWFHNENLIFILTLYA